MALPLVAIGLGTAAAGTLAKVFGKDTDYPSVFGNIQIRNGVAVPSGNVQVLDKGNPQTGQQMQELAAKQLNAAIEAMGLAPEELQELNTPEITVGLLAGGRPGAVSKGGFYFGVMDGGNQFLSGIKRTDQGFQTLDEMLNGITNFTVSKLADPASAGHQQFTSSEGFQQKVQEAGGAEGVSTAVSAATGLDIPVPDKFKANNFWQKIGTAAQVVGAAIGVAGVAQMAMATAATSSAAGGGFTSAGTGSIASAANAAIPGASAFPSMAAAGAGTAAGVGAGTAAAGAGLTAALGTLGKQVLGGVAGAGVGALVNKAFSGQQDKINAPLNAALEEAKGASLINAGGLTSFKGADGSLNLTSSADRTGAVQGLSGAFGDLSSRTNELGMQVTPGFGRLTQNAQNLRDLQKKDLLNQRTSAIGSLDDMMARRRVAGSSFAADTVTRANREFDELNARVNAETAMFESQAFLDELNLSSQLLQQESQAAQNQYLTTLSNMNFEAEIATKLASAGQNAYAAISQSLADIQRLIETSKGETISTFAGIGSQMWK